MNKYLALIVAFIFALGISAQALVIPASTSTLEDGSTIELAEINTTGWTTASLYAENTEAIHGASNYRAAWDDHKDPVFYTVMKQLVDEYLALGYTASDYYQLSHHIRSSYRSTDTPIPPTMASSVAGQYITATQDNPGFLKYACHWSITLKYYGYQTEYVDMANQLLAIVPLDEGGYYYFKYGIASNEDIVSLLEAKTAVSNMLADDRQLGVAIAFLKGDNPFQRNKPYVEYTVENVVNAISPWSETKNNDATVVGAITCFNSLPWISMTVQEGIDACNRCLMVMPVNETTAPFLSAVKDKKRILVDRQ